nr:hypothetical protein [Tanacetum cinerariifolium]
IEVPGDLKELTTKLEEFTTTVTGHTSQVTQDLNMFTKVLLSAKSRAGDQRVPLAGQARTMLAEAEKNTNQATIS